MQRIYLDHSATTPIDKKVLKTMLPYLQDKFGNPSSIHQIGREAMDGVNTARAQVASFLNSKPDEIVFTSGSTESNNLAIKGLVESLLQRQDLNSRHLFHIITSTIEHHAVLESYKELKEGRIEVTYIPVQQNGVVDYKKVKNAIRDNTVLVSIMYVNNEVGAIQPISEIGRIIKKINKDKAKNKNTNHSPKIYFHTDAKQAVNFLDCDTQKLNVDLLSFSGHKIYGPKGVGVLFVKDGTPIVSLQKGGHQENNLRSGTLNVPGIVGLGQAIALLEKSVVAKNNKKIGKLRDMLIAGIQKNIPDCVFNIDTQIAVPSHAHISFLGTEGESILLALDAYGIAVSTGSACSAKDLQASHVLLAMDINKEKAHNSIRFSLGKNNTTEEVKKVLKVLPPIVQRFRKISPLYNK